MSVSSRNPYVESLPPSVMALAGGMGGDWVMRWGPYEGGQGPSKEPHGAHPLSCPRRWKKAGLHLEEGPHQNRLHWTLISASQPPDTEPPPHPGQWY